MADPDRFKKILIVFHPKLADALQQAVLVTDFLQENGVSVDHGPLYDEEITRQIRMGNADLLIAIGGDGTMLRAGNICAPYHLPILGINMGRFGFLAEIRKEQWRDVFSRMLAGDYWIEHRMMLTAQHWRGSSKLGEWEVLNDAVVSRGHQVRPVQLVTHIDGRFLTTYVADALIVSTATGSTAYALAAGGPILPPEMRNILLVPVAPHLSIDRAIILAEGSSVSIIVNTAHQAVISPDGHASIDLLDEDRIDVFASKHSVQFIRFQDPGYFYRNLTPHMSQNPSIGNQR